MGITHEQYADMLIRVARIQQRLQSYYRLPLALEEEIQNRGLSQADRNQVYAKVDRLRSMAAHPDEVNGLKRDLRQLQKNVREYERSQTGTGKIRAMREQLLLVEKLDKAKNNLKNWQSELQQLQSGGIRGFITRFFRRSEIQQMKTQIMKGEREVHLLQLAAPRPRQAKGIKKSIERQFADKSEREIKQDIYEMKKQLQLYQQAERDRKHIKYFKELANVKGLARLRLFFQNVRDLFLGWGEEQRRRRVDAARGLKVVKEDQPPQRKISSWQAFLRSKEIYLENAAFFEQRLALYSEKVPTPREAERLKKEIRDWSAVLTQRQIERKQQEQQPKKTRKRTRNKKQQQVKEQQQKLEVVQTKEAPESVQTARERVIRVSEEERRKLEKAQIAFRMIPEENKEYVVMDQSGKQEERVYQSVQIELFRNQIPEVEKILGRSLETDPEVGTIRYAQLVKESGKNLLIKGVSLDQLEQLRSANLPFAAFQKEGKVFNLYCKKSLVNRFQDVLLGNDSNKRADLQLVKNEGRSAQKDKAARSQPAASQRSQVKVMER